MSEEITDYNLPETAYTTFDAQSLKGLIIDRLQKQGTFTDQIYEGSNLSSFIDIIAYSYHVLMFYLNRTASESVFTESTIYENVNRIVKLLNYNPLGFQTCTLAFEVFASEDLAPGTYTIPRYTFINNNGVTYSFSKDISFTKYTTSSEKIAVIGDGHLLYQGEWIASSPITSIGAKFETISLSQSVESDNKIDHFNIGVYVKHKDSDTYYEYTETTSLFLHKSDDLVFEKRLNEDLSYEIKFGNNVTGRQLQAGDIVQVYYLESKGDKGRVGPNFLDDSTLVMQGTSVFNNIIGDVLSPNVKMITFDNLEMLSLSNESPSTYSQDRESIDEIKRKAPIHHGSQDRVVTKNDFETYVTKNYDRILAGVKVVDNNEFLDGHFKYLVDTIGINNPSVESRIMFNHLEYASTNTSNNIYIYGVPKIARTTSLLPMTNYLNPAQKQLIQSGLDDVALIVNAGYPDIRRVINAAQRQIVDNKLKIDTTSVIQNNYKLQLLEMLTSGVKLNDIRQLIADNSISDYSELFRLLYDEVDNYGKGKQAECIMNIAEAQFQDVNVVDKEINFMSLIIRLLRLLQ